MKFASVLLLALAVAAPARAGLTFDVTPSSSTTNINGIRFSPIGGPLIVTDTPATSPAGSPLYLDFGVDYDHTDAAGDVVYRPRNDVFQLYILTGTLLRPPGSVVAEGVFVGSPTAVSLGDGRYDFRGDFLGAVGPAYSDLVNPGSIDLVFDVTRPLGHQVIGGTVTFGASAVPEPGSMVLVGVGVAMVAVLEIGRRRGA